MNIDLKSKDEILLWWMLLTKEEPRVSEIRPKTTRKELEPLVKHGIIEIFTKGRATHVRLADKAWDWATTTPPVSIKSSKSPQTAELLQLVISRLVNFVSRSEISLLDVISHDTSLSSSLEPAISHDPLPSSLDIPDRIIRAYRDLTGGSSGVRVKLSALREKLQGIPRELVDKALGEIELSGQIVLMHLDDPREIQPQDEEAAIRLGDTIKHIVYLKE